MIQYAYDSFFKLIKKLIIKQLKDDQSKGSNLFQNESFRSMRMFYSFEKGKIKIAVKKVGRNPNMLLERHVNGFFA